jgi:hypothetical protein
VVFVLVLLCFISEKVSKYILIKNGYLDHEGRLPKSLMLQISFWQGGLESTPNIHLQGYNDSLLPVNEVFTDQYGFIHGDSLPLQLEKDSGTIRIVLMGGSGMRGNLQSWSAIKMFNYPCGIYDYETSIAGKLKSLLSTRYPNIKWEVINASTSEHLFNQSVAEYFQQVHDLHPDIIISMDGYNDNHLALNFADHGDPYLYTAKQASEALRMEILKRWSGFHSYTWLLINLSINGGSPKSPHKDYSKREIYTIHNLTLLKRLTWSSVKEPKPIDVIEDSFSSVDPYLIKMLNKQMWLYDSFGKQLKKDSVYWICCYQPILDRRTFQKKLSEKELVMRNFLAEDRPDKPYRFDSLIMEIKEEFEPGLRAVFNKMGAQKYFLTKYHNTYFINSHISPTIDSIVRLNEGSYVDIGKEMQQLPASTEFYLDYTHTTPAGNLFIAKCLAAQVDTFLRKKGIKK